MVWHSRRIDASKKKIDLAKVISHFPMHIAEFYYFLLKATAWSKGPKWVITHLGVEMGKS